MLKIVLAAMTIVLPAASALLSCASGLSTVSAQRLCYASSLSYCKGLDNIATKESCTLGKLRPLSQIVEPSSQSGVTVFESTGCDVLVVAFRGSANPKNFLTNLRLRLVPLKYAGGVHPSAKVHEGFQDAAQALWGQLQPELETLAGSGGGKRPAVFTGHSLGAATAQLCALEAARTGKVSELVTFGGPLIGDGAFATHVSQELASIPITHIVHNADPILQNNRPLWAQLGFQQTGREQHCEPYSPILYADSSSTPPQGGYAWNMLDHCRYLGVYVGPRWQL